MPQLKNLDIRLKTMRVDNYTVIEKTKPQKASKWVITPSVGIGYGLVQQKPDIYIGISIGYKL